MSDEKEPVTLKLTSAVALGGSIRKAGALVEVSEPDARNLLDRGKAVLATDKTKALAPKAVKPEDPVEAASEKARAMADNHMDAATFDALSPAKRNALLKQAADAIAKVTA